MSVVLRCPNCGTTRAAAGECEGCHEAKVRYFCTNHEQGVWLDGPTCRSCGAGFGAPPRPVPVPAPRTRVPAPAPPARTEAPASSRLASPGKPVDAGSPVTPLWPSLFRAALHARYRAAAGIPDRERWPVTPGMAGCAKRLMVLLVLGFLAISTGLFLFGKALFFGL